MSSTEKVVKFTISMDRELRDWVDEKVEELNRKDRRLKTSRSAVIADAVEQMRQHETTTGRSLAGLGNPQPQSASANVIRPSATSAGGSSTAPTKSTRQAGKAK